MENHFTPRNPVRLSVIVPCFNEERTLTACIKRVLAIANEELCLEIIIVDDCSTDRSRELGSALARVHPEIVVFHHDRNRGKGAALRTGFQWATGDFVVVQDADLEYDPNELKALLQPLLDGRADVVIGSRFISRSAHRVLYFWHSLGNRFLTLLSNMFTDLNLTDMESCYKVFRRDVIQSMSLEEDRFGFEPEVVAKAAHMRLRIYEVGISYYGRTYEEGKKIGIRDGFRALYCILRYNLHRAPLPIQFFFYLGIGASAALVNFVLFLFMTAMGQRIEIAAPVAFVVAAAVNYLLSVVLLFRHKSRWNTRMELATYILVVAVVGYLDLQMTAAFIAAGMARGASKLWASAIGLGLNFIGRRYIVFSERPSGPWKPDGVPPVMDALREEKTCSSKEIV